MPNMGATAMPGGEGNMPDMANMPQLMAEGMYDMLGIFSACPDQVE